MFNKILIANRGEVAVRVIRACKEMGIATVAVYSEADKQALFVQMADQAVCIGKAPSKDSYLNMQNIMSAALLTNAEAIHPGYGFLSENSTFAALCEDCRVVFIGPKAESIEAMGNKANAKSLMIKAKVPTIPGTQGVLADVNEAIAFAEEHGYPVLIKAAAGGGGKGIRLCENKEMLISQFAAAKTESLKAFGDDSLYLEKALVNARHIEIQVLADKQGNTIHLGERECSMQLGNQKVLEEAPSSAISETLRKDMGKAAIAAAKACEYQNAGTLEFLVADDKFYFMEMNTRIQVEHPITEMVTGIDLVKEQIKIAYGESLAIKQSDINISGHAIECRINARSAGHISYLLLPAGGLGLRVDAGIYAGCNIPPFYDSMIAKIITHDTTRAAAISKMRRALDELVIEGIESNIDMHLMILDNQSFVKGDYHTKTLEQIL